MTSEDLEFLFYSFIIHIPFVDGYCFFICYLDVYKMKGVAFI